jgi:hypothetical protein
MSAIPQARVLVPPRETPPANHNHIISGIMYRKTKEYIIMTNEFEAICSLVRGCGEIIRNADRGNIRIDEKSGPADFVTDYDKKVQDMLQRGLADIIPDAHFIGKKVIEQFRPSLQISRKIRPEVQKPHLTLSSEPKR